MSAADQIWLEPECVGPERCWSSDPISDCDECHVKASRYLLASPLRDAAADLLEATSETLEFLDMMLDCWVTGKEISDEEARRATAALFSARAAISKATGASSFSRVI